MVLYSKLNSAMGAKLFISKFKWVVPCYTYGPGPYIMNLLALGELKLAVLMSSPVPLLELLL